MGKRTFIVADWFAFGIVPIALLYGLYFQANGHTFKEWGEWSLNLLYLILFMKPIVVILGYARGHRLLPYRRQLGMVSFRLALFHTIGLVVQRNLWDISYYLQSPRNNFLLVGAIAMVMMLILGLTSNFFSMRLLGKNWKRVQRLAYPALFFTKLHADLSKMGGMMRRGVEMNWYTPYVPTLSLLVIFIVLKYRQHQVETKQRKSIKEMIAW